jgi:hypothetical protein
MATSAVNSAPAWVLVVDDDEDTRLNLSDILELAGYHVRTAGTARELFDRASWEDVALVLLDRKLPDGSSHEVLPFLAQKAPLVEVIVVTGYADIEGAISALQSGAADYILKPVNPDALIGSVRRALKRQQDEQEIGRLNAELIKSESQYRALFENTLDGLVIFDDAGRIVAVNPAAGAKIGAAPQELRGRLLNALRISSGGQSRPVEWNDFFSPKSDFGECTLLRDDGSAIDVEFRAVTGFTPGLHLLSLRDVTARKQAEERVRQSQRLAAIGETMAALVHESRNAMQRSQACLEMLKLELEQQPEALALVDRAQRAQDDLHRLYEEVRQWAAPLNLRREPCNLQELWTEVWRQLSQTGPQCDVRLDEELACDPVCPADRFALGQVFRNVFENALEVSPPGATVTVRCAVERNHRGEEVLLAIEDEGPGLTAQQAQRIFEPFFTTKAKGTGLGMAIVQRIVHSHGGSIAAASPRGARIEIRLPRGGV